MASHTVVYQSFRTQDVPRWIQRCMQTVQEWTALRGFDYHFVDDRLFDYVPAGLRARTQNKVILSDLARLLVGRELLQSNHQRAVWIDADVAVFDPNAWQLPTESNYYFCHELWPTPMPDGVRFDYRANNAVCIFSAGNPFLEFYIDGCRRILESDFEPNQWMLGTRFLKAMLSGYPVPVLANIGMLDPTILQELARGTPILLPLYVKAMGRPLVAANFCFSAANVTSHGLTLTESVFDAVVQQCIASKGEVINQHLRK
jgi:hypothetical protein